MTQERDKDSEFEAYLQGKSGLSDLYADLPPAKLPEHLDAAILAEAHRAVHARPGGKPRRSWVIPLSMAASLFVAVILGAQLRYLLPVSTPAQLPASAPPTPAMQPAVPQAERRREMAAPAPGRSPAEAPRMKKQATARPAPAAPAAAPGEEAPQESQDKAAVGAGKKEAYEAKPVAGEGAPAAAAAPPPAAPAPPKVQAEAAPIVAEESARETQNVKPAPEGSEPRASAKSTTRHRSYVYIAPAAPPAATAASAPAATASMASGPQLAAQADAANLRPEDWLARIRKLQQQGKLDEAKKELGAFRKRYPDYAIPADLKGLAAR